MNHRFKILVIVFSVLLVAVVVRLICINAFDGTKYKKTALSQAESSTAITSKRGDITDCNGVTLATSVKVYDIMIDPKVILSNDGVYLEPTVAALVKYFGYDEASIRSLINDNSSSNYLVIAKKQPYSFVEAYLTWLNQDDEETSEESSEETAEETSEETTTAGSDGESAEEGETETSQAAGKVVGIHVLDSYQRNYPYNTLACSVLGFMEDETGVSGLEEEYNEELTGTDGIEYSYVNGENILETVRKDAVNGDSIMTTLDYNVQSIAEKYMAESLAETEAESVAVLIMNPNTGEIYAMADSGVYDCNNPHSLLFKYSEEELKNMPEEEQSQELLNAWNNFCISTSFEPGSTFKPFTVSMGIEEDIIGREEEFVCTGSKTVMDEEIHCYNWGGDGTVSVQRAIAISCNVSLMQMAERIGVDTFCKYQSQFGFGQLTGIDLPDEISCRNQIYTVDTMSEVDLETNSFGQNFNCTMIQMAAAFSALVNGGYYYKPYIVKKVYDDDGNLVKSNDATLVSRILSSDTCDFLKECLRSVVTEGTGTEAEVAGYDVAGKTGTAEIRTTEEDDYVVSFIGCAPYENPQVVCYVVLCKPNTGDHSYPGTQLFSKIMTEVLPYLNIAPVSEVTEETTEEVYYEEGGTEGTEDWAYTEDAAATDTAVTDDSGTGEETAATDG